MMNVKATCENCQQLFTYRRHHGAGRFCTHRCYLNYNYENRKRYFHCCQRCGITFETDRNAKGNFCSIECRTGKPLTQPRTCPTCGVVFTPKNSVSVHCSVKCWEERLQFCAVCNKVSRHKYCGRECFKLSRRRPRTFLHCSQCGLLIPDDRDLHAMTCSVKCQRMQKTALRHAHKDAARIIRQLGIEPSPRPNDNLQALQQLGFMEVMPCYLRTQ